MNASQDTAGVSVLCVDDNPAVARALETKVTRSGGFIWAGTLASADEVVDACCRTCPNLVILDVDMPGISPFEAILELTERCPDTRAIMFSGHVRRDLVEQSIDAGAWGYVSKNDGEDELIRVLRRVHGGEIAFSPEAEVVYHGGL